MVFPFSECGVGLWTPCHWILSPIRHQAVAGLQTFSCEEQVMELWMLARPCACVGHPGSRVWTTLGGPRAAQGMSEEGPTQFLEWKSFETARAVTD